MSTKDRAVQFGDAVRARREELSLSQMEVWASGGPSNTTLTIIENGRLDDLTPATARKLDVGMQWDQGSSMRLWREGRAPNEQPTLPGVFDRTGARLPDGVASLAQWVELLSTRLEELEERVATLDEVQQVQVHGRDPIARAARQDPSGRPSRGQRLRAELDSTGEESQE